MAMDAGEIERLIREGLPDALNAFAWSLGAQDDVHASAAYRRHLVRELGQQLIEEQDHARVS